MRSTAPCSGAYLHAGTAAGQLFRPFGLLAGEQGPWGAPGVCGSLMVMSPDVAQQPTAYRDPVGRQRPAIDDAAIDWRALRTAGRACCCPARPTVVAIMPPAPGRDHPTDLLLCAHHYRVSRVALERAGATVFDGAGRRVMPPACAFHDGR